MGACRPCCCGNCCGARFRRGCFSFQPRGGARVCRLSASIFPIEFPFYYPPYPYPYYPPPAYYSPPPCYPAPASHPPAAASYQPSSGYRATERYGTACRDASGQWRIVN